MSNSFFKATPLYKEFLILDLIEKNKNITQREISDRVGIAVSMVNMYLDDYERSKYIRRKYHTVKTVEYFITRAGIQRKQLLNIAYLSESLNVFKFAKRNIILFLQRIMEKGFTTLLLYGAGEVAEILLQTLITDSSIPVNVIAVIDDDKNKIGKTLMGYEIVSIDQLREIEHDGILVSSYTNREVITLNLLRLNYNESKILQFFD